MQKFVISGGNALKGEVAVSGSKNGIFQLIAASLLTKQSSKIKNVPIINDVMSMRGLLKSVGAASELTGHTLRIDGAGFSAERKIDKEFMGAIRGSVVLLGPLLARFGKAKVVRPGGDRIGARPITTHLKALNQMGVSVKEINSQTLLTGKPRGAKVVLDELSPTATATVIMAAVLAKGVTELKLAAAEPHLEDLARMLTRMGAKIKGAGTHNLSITGVKDLKGVEHRVIPDQLDAGTYAIAAAATNGNVLIKDFRPEHNELLLNKFEEMGVKFRIRPSGLEVLPTTSAKQAVQVKTLPYPGFPSDLQAPISVLLTQCRGTSSIFEALYEGRLSYLYELQKMGASVDIQDRHSALIHGPTPLKGAAITSFDIRAGATLIIAALVARGTSEIHDIGHIDRGYEDIEGKLKALGAKIERAEMT